jgi:Flp pilus assembly protein TadD
MLGKTYSRAAWQNYIPQQEGYEKARTTVMKALSIDSNNTDALITLAGVKLYYDFEWKKAEELVDNVLQLEPTNAAALNILAVVNQVTGKWKKAIQYHNKAISFDPLRPILYSNQGANYTYSGEYDKASDMYRKALEINPSFQRAHMYIGRSYLLTGKPQLALREMQKENIEIFKHFGLALAYHALKEKKMADSLLNSFVNAYHKEWPYLIAELYAFRNEKEESLSWLEKAYSQNDSWLTWIKGDPLLKNIWKEPGYISILKKMNLQ